ncbi:MAG: Gfo/Idh/MocA family oxidoreductase [Bacillota bacterium]|nr:Gfo/Idh/MocA family oxidoreductase [Bacillota bacterium]
MDKVRIALIGAGNIGKCHLERYKKDTRFEVAAICDFNELTLNETADIYGIEKRYTDIDEMLSSEKLDAADVCVWNCNHAKCSIKALNAGLHVFCEKPMAYSVAEAEAMKEAAEKNNRILMIGFVMRFSNESTIAKDFIDNGYLGEIYYSKATYLRRHGNPCGWFSDKSRSGGGPVLDLGVHVIDHTRYLMGNPKPVSVYATTFDKLKNRPHIKTKSGWMPKGATTQDLCDVEDMATALIRYDNGAVTLLETSFSLNTQPSIQKEIYGTKGGMSLEGGLKIYSEMNDYLVDITPVDLNLLINGTEPFEAEIKHFGDCVLSGTKCMANADDGIVVMKILEAIYKSAKTGHEVIID